MISVDGDTSTNDTVLVLANGEAGNDPIKEGSSDYDTFYEALSYVLTELSKKIAGDGEGCTCLFEVQVKGASTKEQARILAKSITPVRHKAGKSNQIQLYRLPKGGSS